MKQSEKIKKQCTTATKTNGIFVKSCDVLKAQRQTAIEFAKWVNDEYYHCGNGKYLLKDVISIEYNIKHYGKTLDQLYEEWESSNK